MILVAILGGCIAAPGTLRPTDTDEAKIEFAITVVDPDRVGSEPTMTIAPDGTIAICSPRMSALGVKIWISTDGGATFTYPAADVTSQGPAQRTLLGDHGGLDCALASNLENTIYQADGNGPSVIVSRSTDRGATWTSTPITHAAGPIDRPWIATGPDGSVYVLAPQIKGMTTEIPEAPDNGAVWIDRSTDGAATFPQQVMAIPPGSGRIGLPGSPIVTSSSIYFPWTKYETPTEFTIQVAQSKDNGNTWTHAEVARHPMYERQCATPLQEWAALAADDRIVAVTYARIDPENEKTDLYYTQSTDSGAHWSPTTLLTPTPGTRYYPAATTNGHGAVAIGWYETNESTVERPAGTDPVDRCPTDIHPEAAWHVRFWSRTLEGQTTSGLVQKDPVFAGGDLDRPFAELMGAAFTPEGNLAFAYVSDDDAGTPRPMFAVRTP